MTSVLGVGMPKVGITKQDFTSPKNIALGTIAATGIVGGGVLGALRGSPLKGLGIGAAVAAVAVGAALVGNAGDSQRDGWCDYYGDPDCDYPGTTRRYPPYGDPYVPYDPYYDDYPDTDYGRSTSRGDDSGFW